MTKHAFGTPVPGHDVSFDIHLHYAIEGILRQTFVEIWMNS
jgi:hypothetical protein